MDKNNLVKKLGKSIKERDKEQVALNLRDFIVSFYPEGLNEEGISKLKEYFNKEFGLIFDKEDIRRRLHYSTSGINNLLEAFDEKKEDAYLFGFFTGTSGQRLYFNTVKNTVRYTGGLNNGAFERFLNLYGSYELSLDENQ